MGWILIAGTSILTFDITIKFIKKLQIVILRIVVVSPANDILENSLASSQSYRRFSENLSCIMHIHRSATRIHYEKVAIACSKFL